MRDQQVGAQEAVADQERSSGRRLGEVLEDLGVLGASDALLGRYEQDFGDPRRLGEILSAQGRATEQQVAHALAIQDRERPGSRARSAEAARVASPAFRRTRNLQSMLMFAIAFAGAVLVIVAGNGNGSLYGLAALAWLTIRLVGSVFYRPYRDPVPSNLRVAVIVAVFNEDPRAFGRCLDSIISQSHVPDEIWVVDDGSEDSSCADLANLILRDLPGNTVIRNETNRGKRHAQSDALRRTDCDIVVTVDSDTMLDPSAIAEGLRPFADERVQGVTGNVRALNHRTNLLTRLIDLRYANAFLFERAAYSTVGSVVCCCGSLSFFRTRLLQERLRDFVTQRFLGVVVHAGDDRRLTQYALAGGRVVLQDTSVGYTLVPERLGHFRRQQVRWNKSFFRESLWAIRHFGLRRWPFWISLAELLVWIGLTASLITAIFIKPIATGTMFPWEYAAFGVILAYARNVRYFGRPNTSLAEQATTYALAPVYALLHVMLLTPMRLWALLTIRSTKWGTRTQIEVRA